MFDNNSAYIHSYPDSQLTRQPAENSNIPYHVVLRQLNVLIFLFDKKGELVYHNNQNPHLCLPDGMKWAGPNQLWFRNKKLKSSFQKILLGLSSTYHQENCEKLTATTCVNETVVYEDNVFEFSSITDSLNTNVITPQLCLLTVFNTNIWNSNIEHYVKRIYKLTEAETNICGYLFNSTPTKTIAKERNTSVETVKSQLRSILQKTNARNRYELAIWLHQFSIRLISN